MSYDDTSKFGLQGSEPEQNFRKPLGGKNGGTKESAVRPIVRITSFRVNLLDEDNLAGGCKQMLDGLRYAGLIHGDSPQEIQFIPSQVKVQHRKEEHTEVDIEYA